MLEDIVKKLSELHETTNNSKDEAYENLKTNVSNTVKEIHNELNVPFDDEVGVILNKISYGDGWQLEYKWGYNTFLTIRKHENGFWADIYISNPGKLESGSQTTKHVLSQLKISTGIVEVLDTNQSEFQKQFSKLNNVFHNYYSINSKIEIINFTVDTVVIVKHIV